MINIFFHTLICLPNIDSLILHIFVEYLLCARLHTYKVERTQW